MYRLSYTQGRMASISEQRPIDLPYSSYMSGITQSSMVLWNSSGEGCCGGENGRPIAKLPNYQVWVFDPIFGQMIFDYSTLTRIA
jgi:hypothetical protein